MEVLVSGREAACCPLGFFPPPGWPRSQTWSTRSLPVQRPAACLPGPLTGLVFPGEPSTTPAKWMQRAMAPLKRQTSLRLEDSQGLPSTTPCTLLLPPPSNSSAPVQGFPLLVGRPDTSPSPRPDGGFCYQATQAGTKKVSLLSLSVSALRFSQAQAHRTLN